jgi:hypothetical protein
MTSSRLPRHIKASFLFFLSLFFPFSLSSSFYYQLSPLHIFAFFKSYIFKDITQCSPLKVKRHFGGTYHHLESRRISQARKQLGLFFNPENGGKIFL